MSIAVNPIGVTTPDTEVESLAIALSWLSEFDGIPIIQRFGDIVLFAKGDVVKGKVMPSSLSNKR